jgi:hypothetical protein
MEIDTRTWTHGNGHTNMDSCTWTHAHGLMDMGTWTWTHGHGHMDMDTQTWTHGHGHMDMDTWTWTHGHGHMNMLHQAGVTESTVMLQHRFIRVSSPRINAQSTSLKWFILKLHTKQYYA